MYYSFMVGSSYTLLVILDPFSLFFIVPLLRRQYKLNNLGRIHHGYYKLEMGLYFIYYSAVPFST